MQIQTETIRSNRKPETCIGCPLYDVGEGFALGSGPIHARIVKVGEALGGQEAENGRVFSGPAGRLMNKLDYAAGIHRDEMYVMNVLCCRPPKNRAPMRKEIEHCHQYFEQQMDQLQDRHITVALGGTALVKLTGLTHITKWRGSVLDSPYGKVIPSVHPASIFRQQNMLPLYLSDMQKVKRESSTKEVYRLPTLYVTSPTETDVREMGLANAAKVGLDIETVGDRFDLTGGVIKLCGLSEKQGKGVSLDWGLESTQDTVRRLLERSDVTLGIHNAQFDLSWLRLRNFKCRAKIFDTMLALHLVSSDLPNDLAFGASVYTDMPFWKDESSSNPALYNCKDVDAHRRLMDEMEHELEIQGMLDLFWNITMRLVPVYMQMTLHGVKQNEGMMVKYHKALEIQLSRYEIMLSKAIGETWFNWRSPKQLGDLLYGKMGLPEMINKKTGRRSCDRVSLELLYEQHPNKLLQLILNMRNIDKLKGTYFSHLYADGRMHPNFLIHGTQTGGRSSSRDPNIQNIPRGPARKALIPTYEDWLMWEADYRQLEYRITAELAGEEELLDIFYRHGPGGCDCKGDPFRHIASEFYHIQLAAVSPTQRQLSKGIVYGLGYGQGEKSLASMYKISQNEANGFISWYFRRFARIKAWRDRTLVDLDRNGYLVSPFARRRYLYGYDKTTKAYIFIPQSAAGDIKNLAMIRLAEVLPQPSRLCFEVHDSIVGECPPELMDETLKLVKEVMEQRIPEINNRSFPIDINVGRDYDEASGKEGLATNWRQLGRHVK